MDIRKSLTTRDDKKADADKNLPAPSLRRALAPAAAGSRALAVPDARTALPATVQGGSAIGFLIDATGSREQTWAQAQAIQQDMFRTMKTSTGGTAMRLRLIHFGGQELKDCGWSGNSSQLTSAMAEVKCQSGATMIVKGLKTFLDDTKPPRPDSIILIGDAFEENTVEAYDAAQSLAKKGIKIFAFFEGKDDDYAAGVFKELARITGGAYAQFGADMPLKDLCNAVAVYSLGGSPALQRLAHNGNRAAKQLTQSENLRLSGPKP